MSRKNKRLARQQRNARWLIVGGIVVVALAIGGGLWASSNSNASGVQAISRLSTADFHSLAFSLTEPDIVFFGHHDGLMVSKDGGQSWRPTSLQNADAMALAASPANPQIMYAAGHNVFYKSTDGGATWQSVAANLPGLDIHGFAADPDNADVVYAHVVGFVGIYRSDDGGSTWAALPAAMPASTFNLAVGETGQTLYAAAGEAGLWRTTDGGETWARLPDVPGEGAIALAYNRVNKRLIVSTLGNEAGLFASDDGSSWSALGLQGTLLAVASSPLDSDHLIAVDDKGRVYASRDGGLTWPGQ